MCFRDLLDELQRRDVRLTESQIRWAIRTGKVARPLVDGSLRFKFSDSNVDELADYFRGRDLTTAKEG